MKKCTAIAIIVMAGIISGCSTASLDGNPLPQSASAAESTVSGQKTEKDSSASSDTEAASSASGTGVQEDAPEFEYKNDRTALDMIIAETNELRMADFYKDLSMEEKKTEIDNYLKYMASMGFIQESTIYYDDLTKRYSFAMRDGLNGYVDIYGLMPGAESTNETNAESETEPAAESTSANSETSESAASGSATQDSAEDTEQ